MPAVTLSATLPTQVDVIIPTAGRHHLLPALAAQIAAQTMPNYQVWLINDGPEPLEAWVQSLHDARWHLVQAQRGQGPAAARQSALALGQAPWIAWCDDDDVWDSSHLARLCALVRAEPDTDLCYAACHISLMQGQGQSRVILQRRPFAFAPDLQFLRAWNFIPPSCMMYRRELHQRLGGLDLAMAGYCDWDWVLRVASTGGRLRLQGHATVDIAIDVAGSNMSAQPHAANPAFVALQHKHGLGPLPASNFWLMWEQNEVQRCNLALSAARLGASG